MSTVVRFSDAWGVWALWTFMDVLMAIFHGSIPDWLVWDYSKFFFADVCCAVFLGWLWLTRRHLVRLP